MTPIYSFNINPIGKPRMTRRDRWARRPSVNQYFEFKDELVKQAEAMGFSLKNTLRVEFFVPMPKSWSLKKKASKQGTPHDSKPDIDNMVKAVLDVLKDEDKAVWFVSAKKYWSYEGKIIIYGEE